MSRDEGAGIPDRSTGMAPTAGKIVLALLHISDEIVIYAFGVPFQVRNLII